MTQTVTMPAAKDTIVEMLRGFCADAEYVANLYPLIANRLAGRTVTPEELTDSISKAMIKFASGTAPAYSRSALDSFPGYVATLVEDDSFYHAAIRAWESNADSA